MTELGACKTAALPAALAVLQSLIQPILCRLFTASFGGSQAAQGAGPTGVAAGVGEASAKGFRVGDGVVHNVGEGGGAAEREHDRARRVVDGHDVPQTLSVAGHVERRRRHERQ